jgi:hypothetical protein
MKGGSGSMMRAGGPLGLTWQNNLKMSASHILSITEGSQARSYSLKEQA